MSEYKDFYKDIFWKNARPEPEDIVANDHFFGELKGFVTTFNLSDKKVLELGSGVGKFQDVVKDYTGADVVEDLKLLYHKPFLLIRDGETYPLRDSEFDAVFTYAVLEHIPSIDHALNEMLRVLKPGGLVLLNCAWQVRPWTAGGYTVRPYRDLTFFEKLIKLSILFREPIAFRLLYIIPQRIARTVRFLFDRKAFEHLEYKKLKANYDVFWTSDSDACNYIDPHAAILWFLAHNCTVLNYPNLMKAFFVRTGSLTIRKN